MAWEISQTESSASSPENTGDIVREGNLYKQVVTNPGLESLLSEVSKQLKIMNIYLSLMTDEEIKKSEVS